ncbi:YcaO-like family protein [Streptomyces sp. NBC_01429]|uniref:YcaO-like family protein n=1 Tax=Streptomyces sp. NBC_01429 TaxID=2903862 RepID=UPI002E2D5F21|nr:YcaO-like family protein [Streptomyces sp. NBC_01429]
MSTSGPQVSAWAPQVFTPYPDTPELLLARVAARSPVFGGTSAAGGEPVLIGSAAGHDRDVVATGARGELLERMGNVLAGREAEAAAATVATYDELLGRGVPVRRPSVRPRARRLWVRAHTTGGEERYVPAASVFLHHRPPAGCVPEPSAGSTGIAAHPHRVAAARHAAWEVLERDLVRRSWYGLADGRPHRVEAGAAGPVAGAVRARGLATTAFLLPAPAGTACAVVCLHRPDGTGQAFGARCGPSDAVGALIEKAAYEAVMVRWSMESPVARRTWDQWRGAGPPTTAVQHALWTYHRQDSLALWNVRPGPAARDDRPTREGAGERARTDPLSVLAEHTGQQVLLVETSGKPARDAGVRVVRVLAPGALPLPSGPGPGHPHPFG